MKLRWTPWLAACFLVSTQVARAEDYDTDNYAIPDDTVLQEPGTVPSGTTTTTTDEVSRGVFGSPFTVTPAVGALGFQQSDGDYTSRIVEGLLTNIDFGGLMPATSRASFGLETGLLFSHVGAADSNFFGADAPDGASNQGSNSFVVPIELALGWAATDAFRTTLNFGANMLYRSIGSSMIVGRGDSDTNSLEVFPSLGLTAGWTLGRSVGLTLRGDYIPVPSDDMFTATIGATFPLV